MIKKLATPKADDYAYIETFIGFFKEIIEIIGGMWDKFIASLSSLSGLVGNTEEQGE